MHPQAIFIFLRIFSLKIFLNIEKTVAKKVNHTKEAVQTPLIKKLYEFKGKDALKLPNNRQPSSMACGLSQVTVKHASTTLYIGTFMFVEISVDKLGLDFMRDIPIYKTIMLPNNRTASLRK
jgi:hypothetical protein